jgi:probable HAF family extracellular repeat protein
MKFPRGLFVILTSLLCTLGLPAWADPGYRLVPLDDGSAGTMVFDLNRRGELVGMRTIAGETHAFRWRAGTFTDLHDTIDPNSSYTQAAGINDFSAIVGDFLTGDNFNGFVLRGTQVSPINLGGQVFPFDINNRGQIIADSGSTSYLIDGANVHQLEGLPGEVDSIHALAINERGVIAGNTSTVAGMRAVLWEGGAVMNLGVTPGADSSFAYALNDRNHVVGIVNIGNASHAMRWRDGVMTLLPRLSQDEAASSPSGINNWGVIVGSTSLSAPQFHRTATLWFGSHVVELDSLVRADDPLKPFVHLTGAEQINDRGDIVAAGVDSRTNARIMYFMTLFDN